MILARRHMFVAILAATAVHAAAAVAVFARLPHPGAAATGMGGIEIALGPAGAAAGAAPQQPAAVTETVVKPEPPPEPEPPTPEPEPVVEPVMEPVPEPVPVAEAVPVEAPEPPEVEPPPEPEPKPEIEPEFTEAPVERLAHVRPAERPKPPEPEKEPPKKELPKKVEPPPQEPPRKEVVEDRTHNADPAVAGFQGEVGTTETGAVGSGARQSGGGIQGARSDYLSMLRAWLERHKDYPRRARLRRQEGTVILRFAMNGQGNVLSYSIERSSGVDALDHAVEEMIRRAQPLPRPPDAMANGLLELVIPVQFYLR